MDIAVWALTVEERVPVTVIDRFYEQIYPSWDTVKERRPAAVVNGEEWTIEQTEQAIRDARVCRCRNCVCCEVARRSREIQTQ